MISLYLMRPAVCLLLGAGCHARGAGPTPVSTSEPELHEGYVQAGGGVKLFYRLVGTKPDTVIVLHGGPGFTMEYLAADLTPLAAHHTLLFYDQRGAGRSSLVTDSAALDGQRFAEDLEAVRKHFGIEHVALLGHSWGAGVAALYGSRYPGRVGRLLIVDAVPLRQEEVVQAFEELDAKRDSATRQQMEKWMALRRADPGDATACHAYYVLWFRPFFVDSTAMGRSQGDFCAGTPASRRNKIISVDRYVAASLGKWDWRPALRRVNAPALVIHGTEDVLPSAGGREWAAALPNARLLLLHGVGHFPYLEAPEAFFPAADGFLRGSWPPAAERATTP
ncbi:MAG: proline iminopeptidase [Gemmatimonadales bacterium]|jgi:proline iminopeptidase|nr:proline iminopeptidase [Gemmatimonadales bacterium]